MQPLIYLFGLTIYNLYFHPLRSYPGPKYAAATRMWWIVALVRGDLAFKVKGLHDQYGEVVRIAPNELSFTTPKAWKDIYGHRHGAPENAKDPCENIDEPGAPSIIFADRDKHSQLRRLLSHAFSEKTLREQEPVLRRYIDLLASRLHEECDEGRKPLDLVRWYNVRIT